MNWLNKQNFKIYFEFVTLTLTADKFKTESIIELDQHILKFDLRKDKNLIHFLQKTGLAGFVYKRLSNFDLIKDDLFNQLQYFYLRNFLLNETLLKEFYSIKKTLEKEKIDFISLKGINLIQQYYEDIGMRPLSDIDILFKIDDSEKVTDIFTGLGYIKLFEQSTDLISLLKIPTPFSFHKKDISIDFHIHIQRGGTYSINTDDLFKRKLSNTLDLNDEIIHLCIHFHKHFKRGYAQLYHLVDIALIINQEKICWGEIYSRSKECHCYFQVLEVLHILRKTFKIQLPDLTENSENNSIEDSLWHQLTGAIMSDKREKFSLKEIYKKEMQGLALKHILFVFLRKTLPNREFIYTNYPNQRILKGYIAHLRGKFTKFRF